MTSLSSRSPQALVVAGAAAGSLATIFGMLLYRKFSNKKKPYREERQVLNALLQHGVNANDVIPLMDRETAYTEAIHLGSSKGVILDQVVKENQPKVVVELGAYFGYSAVRMAKLLKDPEARIISIEPDSIRVAIASKVASIARVADKISFAFGTAEDVIPTLRDKFRIDHVGLIFIDHAKTRYVSDLLLFKTHGLLRPGTVVVADNIKNPGAPEYEAYMKASTEFSTEFHQVLYRDEDEKNDDVVAVSIYKGE
jgi:catechol O-methyltransferase